MAHGSTQCVQLPNELKMNKKFQRAAQAAHTAMLAVAAARTNLAKAEALAEQREAAWAADRATSAEVEAAAFESVRAAYLLVDQHQTLLEAAEANSQKTRARVRKILEKTLKQYQ